MEFLNRLQFGVTKVVDEVGDVLSTARTSIIASIDRERILLEKELSNQIKTETKSLSRRFSFSDAEYHRNKNISSLYENEEDTARLAFETAVLLGTRQVLLKRLRDVALDVSSTIASDDILKSADSRKSHTDAKETHNITLSTTAIPLEMLRKDVLKVNAELLRLHSRLRKTSTTNTTHVKFVGEKSHIKGEQFTNLHGSASILASQLKDHAGIFPPPLQPSLSVTDSTSKRRIRQHNYRSYSSPPSVVLGEFNSSTIASPSSSVKDLTQVVADYKTAAAKLDAMIASAGLSLSTNNDDDDDDDDDHDDHASTRKVTKDEHYDEENIRQNQDKKQLCQPSHSTTASAIFEKEEKEEENDNKDETFVNKSNENVRRGTHCKVIDTILSRTISPLTGRPPITSIHSTTPTTTLSKSCEESSLSFNQKAPFEESSLPLIHKVPLYNSLEPLSDAEASLPWSSPESKSVAKIRALLFPQHHKISTDTISIAPTFTSAPSLDKEGVGTSSSLIAQSSANVNETSSLGLAIVTKLFSDTNVEMNEEKEDIQQINAPISSSTSIIDMSLDSHNSQNNSQETSSSRDSANDSMYRARKAIDALKELSRAILPPPSSLPPSSLPPSSTSLFSSSQSHLQSQGIVVGGSSSLCVSWSTADGMSNVECEEGLLIEQDENKTTKMDTNTQIGAKPVPPSEDYYQLLQTHTNTQLEKLEVKEEEEEEGSSLSFNVSDDGSSISEKDEEEEKNEGESESESRDESESRAESELIESSSSTPKRSTLSQDKDATTNTLSLLHHLSPISTIVEDTITPQKVVFQTEFPIIQSPSAENIPSLPSSPLNEEIAILKPSVSTSEPLPYSHSRSISTKNSGRIPLFSPNRNSIPIRALASQAPPQVLAAAAAAAAGSIDMRLTLATLTSSPHVVRKLFQDEAFPRQITNLNGSPSSRLRSNTSPSSPLVYSPSQTRFQLQQQILQGPLSGDSVFLSQHVSPNLVLSNGTQNDDNGKRGGSSSGGKEQLFSALDAAARLLPSQIPTPISSSYMSIKVSPRSQKRSALHLIGRGTSTSLSSKVPSEVIASTPNPENISSSSTPSSASDPIALAPTPTSPITKELISSKFSSISYSNKEQSLINVGIASPNFKRRSQLTQHSTTGLMSSSSSPSPLVPSAAVVDVLALSASPTQKSTSKPPRPAHFATVSAKNTQSSPLGASRIGNGSTRTGTATFVQKTKVEKVVNEKRKPVERKLNFQSPEPEKGTQITRRTYSPAEDPSRLLIL
jgi:hypothetical protein